MKLFLGALLVVLAVPAFADVVAVTNASFEMVTASGPGLIGCGPGCFFTIADADAIPGWKFTGDDKSCSAPTFGCAGQFEPGPSGAYNLIPDGTWIAYLNSGNLTQTVGSTVEAKKAA